MMEKFKLADCLGASRSDLETVLNAGENSEIKLLIEDVSLEFQVVAASEASAGGGVKWWVVSADASGKLSDVVTQKLNLKLKVVGDDGKSPIPMRGG